MTLKAIKSQFFLLGLFVFATASYAQVSLVKDINQIAGSVSSDPSDFTVSNNKLFFIAETEWISNRMLWVSDGTVAGTKPLLNTLLPSSPRDVNGVLYFIGYDSQHGNELWRSDGTEAGTYMVKDIKPGSDHSYISFVGELNGEFYFRASESSGALHYLWKTDGTEAGTVAVHNQVATGGNGATLNGKLYYTAMSWSYYLHATDGTPGNAAVVSSSVSSPIEITKLGNKLVFFGETSSNGKEPWVSDGTNAGTIMLRDIQPGSSSSSPSGLTLFNNELYFTAYNSTNGYEIWKTDGTAAGTNLAIDLIPGSGGPAIMSKLVAKGGDLIFLARDASNVMNLYKSDGTTAGTQSIMTFSNVTVPSLLTENNGEVYFVFNNGSSTSSQLWKTDGTNAGTVLLRTFNFAQTSGAINSMGTFDNSVFFSGIDAYGRELWSSNGTIAGTQLFKDLNGPTHSNPSLLTASGNQLFFVADSGNVDDYLFKSDGTAAGTVSVRNIADIGSEPQSEMAAYNGKVLFGKWGIPGDDDICISDGTAAGTYSLKDIQMGYTYPYAFSEMNGIMYFVTKYSNGEWLWKTDGTPAGTAQVYTGNIGPANIGSYLMDKRLVPFNNNLYFRGQGGELWKSNGTSAGTQLLKDINTNSSSSGSNPRFFRECNNQLFFVANEATLSNQLWKTDGTTAGTVSTGITAGSGVIPFNNNLLVFTSPTVNQQQLIHYNTSTGTQTVIQNWSGYNEITNLTNLDSIMLFTVEGVIWKTNGVTASVVKDTRPTPTADGPVEFKRIDDFLYFVQHDSTGNEQLWRTNGTFCGTNRLSQYGGAYRSIIRDLEVMGGDLYFAAYTPDYSMELWKFNVVPPIVTTIYDTICPNTSLTWNNMTLQSTGSYCQSFTASIGLDSIVNLHLVVDPTVTNTVDTLTSCDSLVWIDGITYTSSTNTPTFTLQNVHGCDSIVTLNLTITHSSSGAETQTACGSYTWPVNGQTYTVSGQYVDTIPNATGCDSIITLDLTIIPDLPLVLVNAFSMPSDASNCVGEAAITISGNADFELDFDNGSQVLTSGGYSLVTDLCAGTHDLLVTDNCGDTLSTTIVIAVDSNYVFNNPFIDSLAQDSLGVTMTNCDIYYNSIDTAYIDSIWATGNTVNVIWNIVDSNGSNFDTTSYVLNNGNGVYWLQLSVFCPFKALGEYFTVTEAIYFHNGSVSTAGLADHQEASFEIYPNPTNDQVHISFSGSDAELTVYDAQGKAVLKDRIQNHGTVSLENLERGVYLFDFNNSNGRSVQRVVKQ